MTHGRTFLWRLPAWAEQRFLELVDQLDLLGPDEEEAMILRDEIRRLPGFPQEATEHDLIRREVTSVR